MPERLRKTLFKCVENLSDVLALPLPYLVEEKEDSNTDGPGIEVFSTSGDGENTDFGPFDDEETRSFYGDIPDYLTTIPPALLGLTVEAIEAKKVENTAKYGESAAESEIENADSVQDLPADAEELIEAEIGANVEGAPSGEGGGKQTTTSCFIHVCCLSHSLLFF
jgi:regulator of nonsense transcripts 2